MPFERYLRPDEYAITNNTDLGYYHQDHNAAHDDAHCHSTYTQHSCLSDAAHYHRRHPHAVQFQIPQFMLNCPPTLAPGGGAEALPAGLLDCAPGSVASSWFTNSGFVPLHSALISRQITSEATPPDLTGTPSQLYHPDLSQRLQPSLPHCLTVDMDPRQRPLPESSLSHEVTAPCIPDLISPPSTGPSDPASYSPSNPLESSIPLSLPACAPSSIGLPVYSTSGFDVLSLLSRVVNRLNPIVPLGPVDMSCSFVIVDVRRHDCPVVYASPTFCQLTGYSEQEVLGRNCRFLQSPTGDIAKGEPRRFVSPEAVSHLCRSLSSSKECQVSLINYRKCGQSFINLVTVIPLRGGVHNTPEEADEVAYHIGFQVDLAAQPARILDKLRDGSHYSLTNCTWGSSNFSSDGRLPGVCHGLAQAQNMTNVGFKGGRHGQMMSLAVSKELRSLMADTTFTDSVPISTGTNMSGPTAALGGSADQGNSATTPLTMLVSPSSSSTSTNRMSASGNASGGSVPVSLSPSLSLLLLEFLPDFLLVLSLKGAFLYVAPSVRLVLGYEPQELVGRGISDVCHPADLVPLMRELKEGSMGGLNIPGAGDVGSSTGVASNLLPKSVDLLFRALPKTSTLPSYKGRKKSSAEQGSSHPTQSASQSSSSPTNCSSDSSDRTPPPYVWLECRGRLHVEPGKGRKAIILSGRARWMPSVRWGNIGRAGAVDNTGCQGNGTHVVQHMTAEPRLCETPSAEPGEVFTEPLGFWALLSSQGTFLVASASVRDVLGWGTSEVIGRSICAMVRDGRRGVREHLEAELAKLDIFQVRDMVDPPPSVVTTSLVHRESHTVPIRLAFYRTPRSNDRVPRSTSKIGVASPPRIHPLNTPLCPIVCQATVLSEDDAGYCPRMQVPLHTEHDAESSDRMMYAPDASLFDELDTSRGSSWQYELQQLKFANQRLQEEVHALEDACAKQGTASSLGPMGRNSTVPSNRPCSSSVTTASPMPIPSSTQLPQLNYSPLILPTLSPLSSLLPSNSLHDPDPPSSGWSSLAGANGHAPNSLKRSWGSEEGPTR